MQIMQLYNVWFLSNNIINNKSRTKVTNDKTKKFAYFSFDEESKRLTTLAVVIKLKGSMLTNIIFRENKIIGQIP